MKNIKILGENIIDMVVLYTKKDNSMFCMTGTVVTSL